MFFSLNCGTKKAPDYGQVNFGATYSQPHAEWLFAGTGRNPKCVLKMMVCDLGLKNYRLEAYCDQIQPEPNKFNTKSLDWQLALLRDCGVRQVILCVGRKVPHWPEYHLPEWVQNLTEAEQQQHLLKYLEKLILHYSQEPLITAFQVENEPFYKFGIGQPYSNQAEFLEQEIALVKKLDQLKRPVIITEPGDWGRPKRAARFGDIVGLSYYGIVYSHGFYWPNRWLYGGPKNWSANIRHWVKDPVWLTELQAEPWGPVSIKDLSFVEASKSMDVARFMRHVNFVTDAGFTEVYFWGAEWWLYQKDQGHPEMWETAKKVIALGKR